MGYLRTFYINERHFGVRNKLFEDLIFNEEEVGSACVLQCQYFLAVFWGVKNSLSEVFGQGSGMVKMAKPS